MPRQFCIPRHWFILGKGGGKKASGQFLPAKRRGFGVHFKEKGWRRVGSLETNFPHPGSNGNASPSDRGNTKTKESVGGGGLLLTSDLATYFLSRWMGLYVSDWLTTKEIQFFILFFYLSPTSMLSGLLFRNQHGSNKGHMKSELLLCIL